MTRTCAYDRAGYGFSDPSPRPAHAQNNIDDLDRLVRAAPIDGPLVLVGHSAGGLYVQMFATDHPDRVAGVVLVATPTRDEARMVWHVLNEEQREKARVGFAAMNAHFAGCVARARSGELRSPEVKECRPRQTGVPALDEALRRQFNEPKHHEAVLSEMTNFSPTDATGRGSVTMTQAIARPFRLGDKPLIVLSASYDRVPPGEAGKRLQAMAGAEEQRVIAASTTGRLIRVPNSGHVVQDDQPVAVISAVREVVERARDRQSQTR
jgi:pimeloyl-ACP methyl ester carboxylesterase